MATTEQKIRLAILRIEKGQPKIVAPDRKLSIAAVADEAGIHRTTIINRHKIIADEIRRRSGTSATVDTIKESRISELERRLENARNEISHLKMQLAKSISQQASKLVKD